MSDPGNANDGTPVACQFTWTSHVRLTKYIDTMISLMSYSFLSLISKISLVGRLKSISRGGFFFQRFVMCVRVCFFFFVGGGGGFFVNF